MTLPSSFSEELKYGPFTENRQWPSDNFKIARPFRLASVLQSQAPHDSPADALRRPRHHRSKRLSVLGNSHVAGGRATGARGIEFDATPERAESQKSPKSKPSAAHGQ